MISAATAPDSKTPLKDDSEYLPKTILELVQAALQAGLREFTTPTVPNDQGRIDWGVRTWIGMRKGRPAAFLVAYRQDNAHFEVLGPEVSLGNEIKPNGIRELKR